jgi:asparagine synthase (glutamine-hydrolysing)
MRRLLGKSYNLNHWKKVFPGYKLQHQVRNPRGQGKVFGSRTNRILAQDIDGYLQSNVLFLLDKVAMAVSLEGRVPLLDHRFVEAAAYLPASWKIRSGSGKYIFKKLLEPYLPHDVLYRKKEGFGAPLGDWIDDKVRADLRRVVENGLLAKSGLLRTEHVSFDRINPWDLWKIACFELWYRIIVNSTECPTGKTLEDFS